MAFLAHRPGLARPALCKKIRWGDVSHSRFHKFKFDFALFPNVVSFVVVVFRGASHRANLARPALCESYHVSAKLVLLVFKCFGFPRGLRRGQI